VPKFTSIWDVTPETVHLRARQLLGKSIVWNYGDEDSPLGSDVGAETFAAYLNFRANQPVGGVQHFIHEQLASRKIPDAGWDLVDATSLEASLSVGSGSDLLRLDDFIIGLAFAQLLLEGALDSGVLRKAITALRRQGNGVVLSFRGGGGEDVRKNQLSEFRQILELI